MVDLLVAFVKPYTPPAPAPWVVAEPRPSWLDDPFAHQFILAVADIIQDHAELERR